MKTFDIKPQLKTTKRCIKCKKEFTPANTSIFICDKCLKKWLKAISKKPIDEFMKLLNN